MPTPCCAARGATRSSTTRWAAEAVRAASDVRAHLTGHVVARDEGERDDGHDRGGNEGEKQLAVEAGADFAQQGTRVRRSARDGAEDGREHEHEEERDRGDDCQLGEVHHVAKERDDRETERVDAAAITEQVHVVRLVVAQQARPYRRA